MEITKDNSYQFSDTDLMREFRKTNDEEMKSFLAEKLLSRFEYNYTQKKDESKDELFGRIIEDWVNGGMNSNTKVAERMARSHRYLVSEMFWLFYEFCRILAKNYETNYYDGRNAHACEVAKKIVDMVGVH